jgi:hypothetical protein
LGTGIIIVGQVGGTGNLANIEFLNKNRAPNQLLGQMEDIPPRIYLYTHARFQITKSRSI